MTNDTTPTECEYLESEIESGEQVMTCPVSGRRYRVTRWASRGDSVVALEKEPVEELATDGSGDPVERIPAEFSEEEPVDQGVAKRLAAVEEFDFHGEPQERTTVLQLLEEGGVAITQRSEPGGLSSSLTLGAEVTDRLVDEYPDVHGVARDE